MGLRNTYKKKFGPFTVNFTKGFLISSATIRMAGVTYRLYSRKSARGVASVDLPGPWSWRPKAKSKSQANNRNQHHSNQPVTNDQSQTADTNN